MLSLTQRQQGWVWILGGILTVMCRCALLAVIARSTEPLPSWLVHHLDEQPFAELIVIAAALHFIGTARLVAAWWREHQRSTSKIAGALGIVLLSVLTAVAVVAGMVGALYG